MIVCNICGHALSALHASCNRCSGTGIERSNPLKGLLTPSQHRGSPDRWAKSYTTPPPACASDPPTSSRSTDTSFDIALNKDNGVLARVYGSVIEPAVQHPICVQCAKEIRTGAKIYLVPRDSGGCCKGNVLCRGCFIAVFSLGNCLLCHSAVLGEREEGGPHVKGRFEGDVWHAKCFVCDSCKTPLIKADHVLLPSGNPSCLDCTSILDEESPSSANRALYPRPGTIPGPSMINSTFCSSASSTATKIAAQTKRQAMVELVAATGPQSLSRVGRLGGMDSCPGCNRKAGPLEPAALNGPLGRRWHQSCLRCGHGTTKGCSKPLDAGASLSEGVAFCRNCLFSGHLRHSEVGRPSRDNPMCTG